MPEARTALAASLPWQEGETLRFIIFCGPIQLGEVQMVAEKDGKAAEMWKFGAHFLSAPGINKVLPVDGVDSQLSSLCLVEPWKSIKYLQNRKEGPSVCQRVRLLDYKKTQVQGSWGYQGLLYRGLVAREGTGESFLFLEDSLEDPVSLLYRIRRDLAAGDAFPERLSLIENKKLIKLGLRKEMESGGEVRVFLKEIAPAKPVIQIPKHLEILFRSSKDPVPLEAKLVWGVFSVRFEPAKTPGGR